MPYEVINLDADESHGVYDTLGEARGCVQFDRLSAYSIWKGEHELVEGKPVFCGVQRVECCEPYDGNDDRAADGLGEYDHRRNADHVDGYDRDDLGISPDY